MEIFNGIVFFKPTFKYTDIYTYIYLMLCQEKKIPWHLIQKDKMQKKYT